MMRSNLRLEVYSTLVVIRYSNKPDNLEMET